ncbi:MAG: hypothetical protein AAGD23_13180 [Pseudomonadota bacterium]
MMRPIVLCQTLVVLVVRKGSLSVLELHEDSDFGPYMQVADTALNLISVFDDLRYDRSDADMLSPAMRRHAISKLGALGFRQVSGTVLEQREADVRCLMPKFHALGASPFDITRYTPKREQDFYLLTPTQTACQFIDHYALEDALTRVRTLITRQPINIYRLMDYLEDKPSHQNFLKAIGHLKYVQREAVESEPLRRRRALG